MTEQSLEWKWEKLALGWHLLLTSFKDFGIWLCGGGFLSILKENLIIKQEFDQVIL